MPLGEDGVAPAWVAMRRLDGRIIDWCDPLGLERIGHIRRLMGETPLQERDGEDYGRGQDLLLGRSVVRTCLTRMCVVTIDRGGVGTALLGDGTVVPDSRKRTALPLHRVHTVVRGVIGPFEYVVVPTTSAEVEKLMLEALGRQYDAVSDIRS